MGISNNSSGAKAGDIKDFAGTVAPAGWLACPVAPANLSRADYPALFLAIGVTWGAGDGVSTFGMPYFPADYAALQANSNVGTSTNGENIAHTHTITGRSSYGSGVPAYGQFIVGYSGNSLGTYGSGSNGGAANKAAGVRVLKCVKY